MKILLSLVGTRPGITKMSSLSPQFDAGFDHVSVIREITDHIRYVHAGMHEIVGDKRGRITKTTTLLLTDQDEYEHRRNADVSFMENTISRIVKENTTFPE